MSLTNMDITSWILIGLLILILFVTAVILIFGKKEKEDDDEKVPDYPVAVTSIALGVVLGMLFSLIKLAY